MESGHNNHQKQRSMEIETQSTESKIKITGIKRSSADLQPIPSNSQKSTPKQSTNNSDQKRIASNSQQDDKHNLQTTSTSTSKESKKSNGTEDSDRAGLLLGQKTIKNDHPSWKEIPFRSQIQLEIEGSKARLMYNQKIVGFLPNSIFSKFESLRKNKAILIKVKKLDSSCVTVSFYLNPNYNSDDQFRKIENLEVIRSLFKEFEYKNVREALLPQLKEIDTNNFKINLLTSVIDKTVYNPFDIMTTEPKKAPEKTYRKTKSTNIDDMILESFGPGGAEEIKKEHNGKESAESRKSKPHRQGSEAGGQVHATLPPKEFTSKLEIYQIEGLNWMLSREGKRPDLRKKIHSLLSKDKMHPVFEEWAMKDGTKIYLNTQDTQILEERPKDAEVMGGILADDEGLGKTVTTIALFLTNSWKNDPKFLNSSPAEAQPVEENSTIEELPAKKSKKTKKPSPIAVGKGGNLIICPSDLKGKWEKEIFEHTQENSLKVFVYGKGKSLTQAKICENDVVIVPSDALMGSGKHAVLKGVEWHRIVLDEAHEYISNCEKTIFELKAKYKWAISRTPAQNTLVNLYEQLSFLKVEPWCSNEYYWGKLISQVHSTPQFLHAILRPIMLRRTKISIRDADKKTVNLPPKSEKTKYVTLTHDEEEMYLQTKKEAEIEFKAYYGKYALSGGEEIPRTKTEETIYIFKKTAKMRQACNHELLLEVSRRPRKIADVDIASTLKEFFQSRDIRINSDEPHSRFLQQRIDSLATNQMENCPICEEQPETVIFTVCGHIFCSECFTGVMKSKNNCPNCRTELTEDDFMPFSTVPMDVPLEAIKRSSKLAAVMKSIEAIAKQKEKCVCFTQWTTMMGILGHEMSKCGIKSIKIDDNCSNEEKSKLLKEFSENPEVTALVVNLMLGGVWLNLTKANHVLLVEPWWNPKAEEQAIALVHRVGQMKPVYVTRFVCEGTIEERLISLAEYKKENPNLTTEQEFRYLRDI